MRQRSDEAIKDEAFDLFYKELLKASKDLYQKLLCHNIAKKTSKKKKELMVNLHTGLEVQKHFSNSTTLMYLMLFMGSQAYQLQPVLKNC